VSKPSSENIPQVLCKAIAIENSNATNNSGDLEFVKGKRKKERRKEGKKERKKERNLLISFC
jgi:hypothetical protein